MNHTSLRRRMRCAPAAAALLLLGGVASAQDIELYERPDFGGERVTLDRSAPDLHNYGMAGRASSVIVHRGEWELCTGARFNGTCVTLGPGRYADLPIGLQGRLASLREADEPLAGAGRARDAAIVLFANEDFRGRRVPRNDATANLNWANFNDRARAVDVREGEWELCSEVEYRGRCLVYGPGRHVLPEGFAGRVSSLRPTSMPPTAMTTPPPAATLPPLPPSDARITLYDRGSLQGRWLRTTGSIANLRTEDYDDLARSVDVQGGRWELCTGRDFSGECVVLQPGQHLLPQVLAGRVSSIRPIG